MTDESSDRSHVCVELFLCIPHMSFPNYRTSRMTLCGTNEYMAPELLFDEGNYSFEIDVFSFGMVLLEIMRRGKVGTDGFAERSPRSK